MSIFNNIADSTALIAGPTSAPDTSINGLFQTPDGYTRVAEGGTIATYSQGVPVDANGSVCVVTDGTIDHYSNGLPFDVNSRICIGAAELAATSNGLPFDADGRLLSLNLVAHSIIASYGADAHLWLPGVGYRAGVATLNFSDSAGTTPAVYGDPIGRIADVGGGALDCIQATTSLKPILLDNQLIGPALDFDGVDDIMPLSGVPFAQADDHFVAAACSVRSLASGTIFSIRSGASTVPIICSLRSDVVYKALYRDDAGTLVTVTGPTPNIAVGDRYVVSAAKSGNDRQVWTNATAGTQQTNALGATTVTQSAIGADMSVSTLLYFPGSIGPLLAIKGSVSPGNARILERWIGSLSGITL